MLADMERGEGPSRDDRDHGFHQQWGHRDLGRYVALPQAISSPDGGFPKLRRPGHESWLCAFFPASVAGGTQWTGEKRARAGTAALAQNSNPGCFLIHFLQLDQFPNLDKEIDKQK